MRESANGVLVHVSVAAATGAGIFGQMTWIGFVTWAVFIIMGAVFVLAVVFLVWYWDLFKNRVIELRSLAVSNASSGPAGSDSEVSRSISNPRDSVVLDLWKEFGKTLVTSADGKNVSATVDAEHYFTVDTLCPEYSHNRLLAAVPGLLATIGVLGTFASLSIGLGGIKIGADVGTDVLTAGVQSLIGAAGFAFLKSVFGVFGSLLITFLNKLFEGYLFHTIGALQHQIDRRYPKITPEQSLVSVADNTHGSMQALQELHERIGDRLQQTVETMSTSIEAALREAISSALQPAMEKLVTTTSEQSAVVFENLVEKFASSFTDIGAKQSAMLDESSDKLTAAIANVGEEFSELVRHSQEHSLEVAKRQAEILDGLSTTRDALTVSSADLKAAATSLSEVSHQIESAGEALGSGLTQTAGTLMSLYEKAMHEAAAMAELRKTSADIDSDLTGAANRLAEASSQFGDVLASFGSTQQEFQSSLRSNSEQMAEALRSHVSDLENQVGQWLVNYSSDIENQIVKRMSDWNTQSQDYASTMLATAKVLAEVVDDIQAPRDADATLELEAAS